MSIRVRFALVTLFFLSAVGMASAADPALRLRPPVVTDTSPAGGWYLRGDIGYSISTDPKLQVSNSGNTTDYRSAKLDNAATFGAGVGYRFNNWLRVDGTLDYRTYAKLNGVFASENARFDPTIAREDTKASISGFTGLVNAYADLGTWSGFTPYLGAGVGVAGVKFGGYSGTYFISPTFVALNGPGSNPCDPSSTCASPSQFGSHTQANLAWALMAGTAIDLSGGLSIDVGYRYLNLGKSSSGNDSIAATGGVPLKLVTKTIDAHEIRVGLRWALGGDVSQPSVPSYVRQ